MKSALANIGEKELSSTAFRLEQAGRENNVHVILSETNEFLEKLSRIIMEIKLKVEENEIIEDSEDALILLNEKLEIIKDACSAMDKKAAKNALNKLRENSWSHKTKELLDLISEHLLHSEFDEASVLIEKHIK
jgi:hypothetical protein